jgi:hypothetical protein
MKIIDEVKVCDKLRNLLGPRLINFSIEFGTHTALVQFGLSDIVIPNNNPPYLTLTQLNKIAQEFGDPEIEFRVAAYQIIMGIIINNDDYYLN